MYIFAVIGVRLTLDYRMAAPEDEYIEDHFGGVFRAMLTFFQIMTTEGWCTIARHLMPSDRSPTLVILIMLFLTITTYAFMNVVVASGRNDIRTLLEKLAAGLLNNALAAFAQNLSYP